MTGLPTTGIGSARGLSTDGILRSSAGISIVALDVAKVGDEGGWEVVASGVFPTWADLYVYVTDGAGIEERCYSGVIGQGDVCRSEDGGTLRFISPPLPVGEGYDVRVETTDGLLSATLVSGLPVWRRSYTSTLYSLRASHPPPRAVGPWDINQEPWGAAASGDNDTSYAALISAIADTLQETSGQLLTRVYRSEAAGFTVLRCEGLHRWPAAGRIVLNGRMYRYTGTDAVFVGGTPATEHYCRLTGVTEDDGSTATTQPVRQGDVVMYFGQDLTAMDQLRAGFFVDTAEGEDLDILARNYGLRRPRGLDHETFRALLKVMIFLDATTIYAVEKILDVLRGPGAYEVYELFPTPGENNRFYVSLQATTGGPRGRAYMTAFESVASSGFTATASQPITVLNGVWASTDPFRVGVNYAETTVAVTQVDPDRLVTAAPFWAVADEGRTIRLSNGELWLIRSYLDPVSIQVGGPRRTDGVLNTASPSTLRALSSTFRAWMEGHKVIVSGGVNGGTYTITSFVSEYEVEVSGATFTTETEVAFMLSPAFTGDVVTATVARATIAGAVVTCPNVLPTNVLLDYATTPSAQALRDSLVSGEAQFPFYLFDDTFIVALILDIVRAAGVEAVVLLE